MGDALSRWYSAFRKPKVTISVIVILLVLFLAGLAIPQKRYFSSREQFELWNAAHPILSGVVNSLGLNEIYVAPITVFFLGLFFLNLLAVLAHRIPVTLRRAFIVDRNSALAGLDKVRDDPDALSVVMEAQIGGGAVTERAISFFRKRLWSVMAADDGRSFVAIRNRFSPLGFLFFHVSFLFCLVGGLLVVYTRFSGNLLLTEGEEFHSDPAQFRRIISDPKIFRTFPELGIKLLRVFPTYEGSTGTDLNVAMKIHYYSDVFDAVAKINEPVRTGAVSILPESIGVSPLFILRKRGGGVVQGGYFSINVLKGAEDSFQFQGLPYTIFVRFYPDYAEEDGKPGTRSLDVNNPAFRLRVEKQGRVLYDALRWPGEAALFDGFQLSCDEIRYWADLLVIREYGTIPLFAGFFLGAIGLIMRLVFFQKTIRVHVGENDSGCILRITGRSEYYPQTFREELARIAADLTAALKGNR